MSKLQCDTLINKLRTFCTQGAMPFHSNEEILEKAILIFSLRKTLTLDKKTQENQSQSHTVWAVEHKASQLFHRILNTSDKDIPLVALFKTFRLNQMEKEVALVMMLSYFGKISELRTMENIQAYLDNGILRKAIAVGKCFIKNSRLLKSRIIVWDCAGDYGAVEKAPFISYNTIIH